MPATERILLSKMVKGIIQSRYTARPSKESDAAFFRDRLFKLLGLSPNKASPIEYTPLLDAALEDWLTEQSK